MIHSATLEGQEKLFYQRVKELCDLADRNYQPMFSFFLTPREQEIAQIAVGNRGIFFGGYTDAVRKLIGIPAPYETLSLEDFPVSAVEILHQRGTKLTHQNVLGSLMNIGITRSTIGDILPTDGHCTVICKNTVLPVIIEELLRIGAEGVHCQMGTLVGLCTVQEYRELTGTVVSMRLDVIVSFLANISRDKAAELIARGMVQRNYQEQSKVSVAVAVEDTLTLRGYGKFIIDAVGVPTKKGRLPIICRKYQ